MPKLRSIQTSFWSDPFIEDLNPSEKLIFLYLITNEKTNMLGIYEVSIRKISFETGVPKEMVQKALKGFERIGKVKRIDNYIVLTNYLKNQNFNTNMKKSAIDAYCALPEALKVQGFTPDRSNPLEAFETLSNRLGMVRKREYEYEYEYEVEVEVETEMEMEMESESESKSEKTHTPEVGSKVVPPTIKEIENEMTLRNVPIDKAHDAAEHFHNHYSAQGWTLGNGRPLLDWKAKVKSWVKDEKFPAKFKKQKEYQRPKLAL